ncbi:hypothetical protein ACWGI8_24355 [Streptomyces sp. NPDC054841]
MKLTLRHPGAAAAPSRWIPLRLAGVTREVAHPAACCPASAPLHL